MGGINDSATSQKEANDSLTILDRFKNEFSNLLTPHIKHRHQVGPLIMSTSTGRSTRKSDTNVTRLYYVDGWVYYLSRSNIYSYMLMKVLLFCEESTTSRIFGMGVGPPLGGGYPESVWEPLLPLGLPYLIPIIPNQWLEPCIFP